MPSRIGWQGSIITVRNTFDRWELSTDFCFMNRPVERQSISSLFISCFYSIRISFAVTGLLNSSKNLHAVYISISMHSFQQIQARNGWEIGLKILRSLYCTSRGL